METVSKTTSAQRVFLLLGVVAMAIVVTSSNILVEMPINDWLTWGALSYPFAFLVTDLTNRALGPKKAQVVVFVGFVAAVIMSLWLADTRIAIASGSAFLTAQLLDVFLFDKLRRGSWWKAPIISSFFASSVDTVIFFSLAFAGTGLPWMTWALGDYGVKLAMIAVLIIPFRGLLKFTDPLTLASTAR
ncbi:VUT family protein [Sneathiella sp. P13V-1]|uniref:VUT family protein n=1 Tax=Sneathiella sp. P13V-1 TaxID=2697366 RepID=UPI00187B6AFF|nr:VUT family protein [Sneathiella sp. P13V-1]MBE7635434.1 VUT family protein [Sneathiella sp. P13V-1]